MRRKTITAINNFLLFIMELLRREEQFGKSFGRQLMGRTVADF